MTQLSDNIELPMLVSTARTAKDVLENVTIIEGAPLLVLGRKVSTCTELFAYEFMKRVLKSKPSEIVVAGASIELWQNLCTAARKHKFDDRIRKSTQEDLEQLIVVE